MGGQPPGGGTGEGVEGDKTAARGGGEAAAVVAFSLADSPHVETGAASPLEHAGPATMTGGFLLKKTTSLRSAARMQRVDSARSKRSNASGAGSVPTGRTSSEADSFRSTRPPVSPTQELCRRIVKNKFFSIFIYLCTAFNTITIGMQDFHVERNTGHYLRNVVEISDWAVLGVFTVEMFLKMYAWGLSRKKQDIGKGADDFDSMIDEDDELSGYFSSHWNTFDCIIVVVSWATAPLAYVANVNSSVGRLVRSVRTARPLRALRSFDGTQDVLKTFPHAIPSMRDGLELLAFVFVVYAILGVNLFGVDGTFHGRCVVDDPGNEYGTKGFLQKDRGLEVLCGHAWSCEKGFRCSCRPEVFWNGTVQSKPWQFLDPVTGDPGCSQQGTGRPWTDDIAPVPSCPDYGTTCFNNFAVALLTCFQTITLNEWTVTMWWAQDTFHPVLGWIYFVSLVVLVSFNIVNLYVASISASYRQVRDQRKEINRIKKARRIRFAQLETRSNEEETRSHEEDDDDQDSKESGETQLCVRVLERINPGRKKLNPLSYACRRLVTYPQVIDECGQAVQPELIALAEERNLAIKFGPDLGQWSLISTQTRHSLLEDLNGEDVAQGNNFVTLEAGQIVCTGESLDHSRKELRAKILGVSRTGKVDTDTNEEVFNDNVAPWFDLAILLCILANTCTMAVESFDGSAVPTLQGFFPEDNCCDETCTVMDSNRCPRSILKISQSLNAMLDTAEIIFSVIFSIELLLKVIALQGFLAHILENFPFNFFDLIVVVVSDAVLVASHFVKTDINVAVLRLMRIIRAIRLVTGFRRLRSLFQKAYSAFVSILYVLFVLVFWHVLGALLAMQLFSCNVRDEEICKPSIDGECPGGCSDLIGDPPQCVFTVSQIYENCPWDEFVNFNTFLSSIVVLLFVTTGESWSDFMRSGMMSFPSIWPGLIFFVVFHVIGFYMLYNLFIGVIVQEFDLTDEQKEGMQLGFFRVKVLKEIKRMRVKRRGNRDRDPELLLAGAKQSEYANRDITVAEEDGEDGDLGFFLEDQNESIKYAVDAPIFCGMLKPPTPNAQFPDDPKNFRAYVRQLLLNVWFDRIILLSIFASAITLAMQSPIAEYSSLDPLVARKADLCFLSVFAFEFLLKILDTGVFWESKRAYFRVTWNLLDFFIMVFQILDVSGLSGLNTVRLFRMLRPLRLLNRIKSLQQLLLAMQACAVDVMNVLILWLFAFIIFAIFGVNLFSGKLYSCNDGSFVGFPLNPSETLGSDIGWRENCVGNYYTSQNEAGDSYVSDRYKFSKVSKSAPSRQST